MADSLTPERRSDNMRRIRSKDMKPELRVRQAVHALGYRYRLHVPDLPGKPDLVLHRHGKIIEVRGCFWHQHCGCIDAHIPKSRVDYWQPKLGRNVARDERNLRALRRQGWRVLVVWECQTRDEDKLAARLERFLTH